MLQMAKKAYQLDGNHSAFNTTVEGRMIEIVGDDVYETSDEAEQRELDYAVGVAGSGLKKAEKK